MPFNPDSVLRRLPDYNDDHSNEIDNNLIEFLKEQRFSSSTQMKRRKNKCLRIAPGVSVPANDSEEEVTEEAEGQVIADNTESTESTVIESEDIQNQPVYVSINVGKYLLVQVKSSRIKGTIYKYAVIVIKKMVTMNCK